MKHLDAYTYSHGTGLATGEMRSGTISLYRGVQENERAKVRRRRGWVMGRGMCMEHQNKNESYNKQSDISMHGNLDAIFLFFRLSH